MIMMMITCGMHDYTVDGSSDWLLQIVLYSQNTKAGKCAVFLNYMEQQAP